MEEERQRTYTREEPRRDGTNDNTNQNGFDAKDLNMQQMFIVGEVLTSIVYN